MAVFVGMIFAAGLLVWGSTVSAATAAGSSRRGHSLRRRLHPAVHLGRGRQRIDLQDDPVGLRGPQPLTGPQRRRTQAVVEKRRGAMVGFADSVGAFGGFLIDIVLRQSYLSARTETPALWIFLVCYVGFAVLTWAVYVRDSASGAPIGFASVTTENPSAVRSAGPPSGGLHEGKEMTVVNSVVVSDISWSRTIRNVRGVAMKDLLRSWWVGGGRRPTRRSRRSRCSSPPRRRSGSRCAERSPSSRRSTG